MHASERIAREIRERIQSGALAPGARAPSARQITKQWGVAIATATKVLSQLREQGLVQSTLGSGTIVLAPRPSVAKVPQVYALTRERIVASAIAIADEQSLAALSMRAIAEALGVATMSLYRHVPGREELIVMMIDSVFSEAPPPKAEGGWREQLQLLARLQWWLGKRHPWLAQVLSLERPQLVPNGMAHTEWGLRALAMTALDLETRLRIVILLASHVRAQGMDLERERQDAIDSGMSSDEWGAAQAPSFNAITAARALPLLSRAAQSEMALDPDTLFEFGLERLLDGIAVLIAKSSLG